RRPPASAWRKTSFRPGASAPTSPPASSAARPSSSTPAPSSSTPPAGASSPPRRRDHRVPPRVSACVSPRRSVSSLYPERPMNPMTTPSVLRHPALARGPGSPLLELQAQVFHEARAAGRPVRRLGILAVRDRVVHAALKQILEPVLEPAFLAGSFGFRPGCCVPGALAEAVRLLDSAPAAAGLPAYSHGLHLDVADCFDHAW